MHKFQRAKTAKSWYGSCYTIVNESVVHIIIMCSCEAKARYKATLSPSYCMYIRKNYITVQLEKYNCT